MEEELRLCVEIKGEEGGRVAEERRGIPGRRGGRDGWGAVAIRKSLQHSRGSSNHRAAISNAYQVTARFSRWGVERS